MSRTLKILALFLLSFAAIPAMAQFYVDGTDPARARWNSFETANYKIIYPREMDSLARSYGFQLEKWREPVGQSAGYLPGQFVKGRMPVILHGYHAMSNGSVAWAPKRLDLYLSPEAYDPVPVPWVSMLSIHEQRHAAQMQTGLTRSVRPFNWIVGEMFNGAASALYGGTTWLEGDAVVAETALTNSGRGRTDSFLNWYMVSFDNDDWRNYFSWRGGSQRYHVLNKYALGYMLISGIRYKYNATNVTADKMTSFSEHPWEWGNGFTIKRHSGNGTRETFLESAHTFYDVWKQNADARGPYMPYVRIVEETDPIELFGEKLDVPEPYTKYEYNLVVGDEIYAVQSGQTMVPGLVKIDRAGNVTRIRPFNYYGGGLELSEDGTKILWSETVQDPRWELASKSLLMSYDIKTGIVRRVTKTGQLYHPYPYQGGVIASDYDYAGGQSICLVGADGGKTTLAKAPDGLQIIETVAIGAEIYASGLSWDGIGIYKVNGGTLECVLEPQPVTMSGLNVHDGKICFTSDRTGVEELHSFDPATSEVCQLTSTRYGGRDYRFSEDGRELIFSASTIHGHTLCKTAVGDLPVKTVEYSDIYRSPIADTLSIQEKRFGLKPVEEVEMSESKKYGKAAHLFKLHSWAPIYFNYDNVRDFSFDSYYETASAGATALFQNSLSTSVLQLGYSAHPDPDGKGPWRHSGHIKWTYTGLYPAFELSLNVNDRLAHETSFTAITSDGVHGSIKTSTARIAKTPYVNFSVLSYIPWRFNSKGWYRGLVPQLRYTITNDMYDTAPNWYLKMPYVDSNGVTHEKLEFVMKGQGWRFPNQSVTASVRGYSIQSTATAAVYPRWGVGAELGYHSRIAPGGIKTTKGERPLLSPMGYVYVYAYVPGILRQQGIKLSAKASYDFRDDSMFSSYIVNTLPRGLASTGNLPMQVCGGSRESLLLSADYAIPIWSGDWNWSYFAYVNRFVLTPHFDYCLFHNKGQKMGDLYSAGFDFNLEFTTLAWISAPITVGVRVDYNGGNNFTSLVGNTARSHWNFTPLFSISF